MTFVIKYNQTGFVRSVMTDPIKLCLQGRLLKTLQLIYVKGLLLTGPHFDRLLKNGLPIP